MIIDGWSGPIHPAADLFPLMQGDEFDALVESIKTQGLREPVWLTKAGELLDGRNRVRACQAAGVKPEFRQYEGEQPVEFAIALNLNRRHLDPGQKAFVALAAVPLLQVEAERRMLAGKRNIPDPSAPGHQGQQSSKWESRTVSQAAKLTGSSGRSVARAKRISEAAPDLAEKVQTGEIPLKTAEQQLKRRETIRDEQQAREIVMSDVPADTSGPGWRMYLGDFRDRLAELPDKSVDLILTDPPYPEEFQPLWSDLAKHATRVLSPQGILVALSGKIQLADVMQRLGEHLNYAWVYAQPLPGSHSRIMARHVLQAWKPWLAYTRSTWPSGRIDWHPDMLDPSSRAKGNYRWQQDPDPARMLIDALCPPGGTVLDPFTGTGSYGVVTVEMGRQFIGVEADTERFRQATQRLGNEHK
jgi:hypothetical protein